MKLSFLARSSIFTALTVLIVCLGVVVYYATETQKPLSSLWFAAPSEDVRLNYIDMVKAAQKSSEEDIIAMNKAQIDRDISGCDALSTESLVLDCRDIIQASIAQSENKIELCSALSNSGALTRCQDNVYSSQAQNTLDKKLCQSIRAKNIQQYCFEQVDEKMLTQALEKSTLSKDFCEGLGTDSRGSCLHALERADNSEAYARALEERDPKVCDTLTDPTFRENCHDAVVLQLAIAEKNTDYCGSIIDETKRLYCETALVMKTDSERFQEVVASGDVGQCNTFIEKKLRYQCADMINMALVRVTYDQTICGNLFNSGLQFACMQIANSNKK